MGRRLVIQHGERVTRHEIVDKAIIIGRDPGCDLFFADQKLSRRHACVEPGPQGVALVDMGSRNGCWVNAQRVEESQILVSGDAIRMGGLRITFEEDSPPPRESAEAAESTVILSPVESGPEVWQESGGSTFHREGGDDTVLFSEATPGTLPHPVLETAEVAPADETGTVVFFGDEVETLAFPGGESEGQVSDLSTTLLEPKDNAVGVPLVIVLSGIALFAYLVGLAIGSHSTGPGGILVSFGLVLIAVVVGAAVFLFREFTLSHLQRPRRPGGAGASSEPPVSLGDESPTQEVDKPL